MANDSYFFKNRLLEITYTNSKIIGTKENFKPHLHDFYEIYYFLNGDVTYYIEGRAYQLAKNNLLLINNRELHKPVLNSAIPYERIVIHFYPWEIKKYNYLDFDLLCCFENRSTADNNKIIDQNKKIFSYLKKIAEYINTKPAEAEIMIETYFIQLLVLINQLFKQNQQKNSQELSSYNSRILKIIKFINQNLAAELSLNSLAAKFYLNKSYLAHIFKENTGFSVLQYIHYKKIMKAKELLLTEKSCGEVASILNFGNYSSFYRAFKKEIGISPQKYQKKIDQKREFKSFLV